MEIEQETEEQLQERLCKAGTHKFVECDEWEPTCIFCGKFLA